MNITYSWHYVRCPPEDECENGHHNCEAESQRCVDRPDGFICECGAGYKPVISPKVPSKTTVCEPVCPLGRLLTKIINTVFVHSISILNELIVALLARLRSRSMCPT